MLSIQQILTAASAAQIRAMLVTMLQVLGVPANLWPKGGGYSSILTVTSNFLGSVSSQLRDGLTAFFLSEATGGFLKILAVYGYGIPANLLEATFATGNATLTNAGGASYTQGIGTVTISNLTTGAQYTNTSAFTLLPFGTTVVPFECTTPGTQGNSTPGTATNMVTTLAGVTVTNPTAIIGLDAPTDQAIRAMCLASLAIRSVRGPRNAYSYAITIATNTITGNRVNINRDTVDPSHTGNVTVVLASPSGVPDPNDVTGVATSIAANVTPIGVTVITLGATGVPYTATLSPTVIAPAGVAPETIRLAIANSIVSYIANVFPIGGVTADDDSHPFGFTGVLASGIYGAAAVGAASVGATLVSMQGAIDLALSFGQVATNSVTTNTPTVISNLN